MTVTGVRSSDVAIVPAASVGVGTVAGSLMATDRVLVPDDEFTPLVFPLHKSQEAKETT